MALKRINGYHLEKMLDNGLAALIAKEEYVNKLNVFPVPDGDTGTNMRKTLENGIKNAKSAPEAGKYLKTLSEGMLLGARGNSGVILSQLFHGFYLELSRCVYIGPGELRNGLIRAYRTAYAAVVHPVEGTILSVAREGIEHIRTQITRHSSIESILAMYLMEMRKTLAVTPDMLPVLKEAGVVDSGAEGFIIIVEGMLEYLYGNVLSKESPEKQDDNEKAEVADEALFNSKSEFKDGYCMEFILQLMDFDNYDRHFRIQSYISDLELYGGSIVAVQNGKRVKVHIHTLRPEKVITLSRAFGEFITFKLENMQIQHNERDRQISRPKEKKPLAIIAVVNGEGMSKTFTELGCDIVIDGGATMNTSSEEFVRAFSAVNADCIAVLPNNPNVILAARQAVEITGAENVTVLNTKSFAEGYFAIAMDVADSGDTDYRIRQMQSGAGSVITLAETTASRDYSYRETSCRKGDEIALINHGLACVSDSAEGAVLGGLGLIDDIDDRETCVLFAGMGVTAEQTDMLVESIAEKHPMLDITVINAGQDTYRFILGIM
ncbi:MAG: DAK2 domain-containing protein [Clostridia bacterium]|nr:DAK2 domain-containing protein [Clostridia bacterium]